MQKPTFERTIKTEKHGNQNRHVEREQAIAKIKKESKAKAQATYLDSRLRGNDDVLDRLDFTRSES